MPCSIVQTRLPGEANRTRAPFGGVIRRWRFRTIAPAAYPLRLEAVRKQKNGRYRFIRRTKPRKISGPGVHRFKASMRIKKGDFIGLGLPPDDVGSAKGFYVAHDGAGEADFFPTPANGTAAEPDPGGGIEYLYNATIRKPHHRPHHR